MLRIVGEGGTRNREHPALNNYIAIGWSSEAHLFAHPAGRNLDQNVSIDGVNVPTSYFWDLKSFLINFSENPINNSEFPEHGKDY